VTINTVTRILTFADKFDMLPQGSRVLACVSGGADSIALLTALLEISAAQRELHIEVAHFNHQLRGGESDRDEAFVRERCRLLNVPCHVGTANVKSLARKQKVGTEVAARDARYAYFRELAAQINADRVATAHTANDNLETILFNMARGTGTRGLAGIPPRRGDIIRPMLTVTRSEVEELLASRGLAHIEDSSNSTDDYARNAIRHHVVPVLTRLNPRVVANASRTAEHLRADDDYLFSLADDFLARQPDNSVAIPDLLELPKPVAVRALRRLTGAADAERVSAVFALASSEKQSGRVSVPKGSIYKDYGKLKLVPPQPEYQLDDIEVIPGQTIAISELNLRILCEFTENFDKFNKSFTSFFFNYENICGKMHVRSRAPGDAMRLHGRDCTKSLKKLFNEARIPPRDRDSVPVLADDLGVLAVYGIGIAERAAATADCRLSRLLRVDFDKI
jgi:tRNA(Ile)-lysidine synthase